MPNHPINTFLNQTTFAVCGASTNRDKYGNKVLRAYQQQNRHVLPINPRAQTIENLPCYPSLTQAHQTAGPIHAISIITPPAITESLIQEAIDLGIQHVWLQPGAESEHAIQLAQQHQLNLIAGGPCLLVVMGYREMA